MGYDSKYGKVTTEHGDIPADEPVVIFRAQDRLSVNVLKLYYELCKANGSPDRHLSLISGAMMRFAAWQEQHRAQVKIPDSERSKEWLGQ